MEVKDFSALRISLASPDEIRSWSYGEVTKPETINYRRLRPEKDGLFCEAIFGPQRDWQCYCGKYKNVRYKGIVCDKCGVEVTRSSVRRERMGHIELAAPVAHVWYTRRVPSHMGQLLDISRRYLDRVLYFAQYIITEIDEEARQKALQRLEEELALEQANLGKETQEQIGELEREVAGKVGELEEGRQATHQRLEEKLVTATERIMKEAQALQTKVEGRRGKKVRSDSPPLIFSPTEETIVESGEVVGLEHLVLLNRAVQEELSRIEGQIRVEQDQNVTAVEADIETLRHGLEEEIQRLRAKLAPEIEVLKQKSDADRKELKDLFQRELLEEARHRELKAKWGQVFKAGMGAEAFYEILQALDLDVLAKELWLEVRNTRSKQRRKKAVKRLQVVEALRKSGNRPEWMVLTVLPVIPPDLRPMVQLDGGRFATSDLNDLYRRVINRNNRLKRLLELGAPDVIVRNEKRMLQEAVDSLIDNSYRGKAMSRRGQRELKSLSDMLKGKKGRFRRNLLGKRVDYSGRSVIVTGPELKLHQCGLPRTMALELYRPFVIGKLVEYNYANNVKGARRLIEREPPEVWEILEEVVKEQPVLLNRAPTLHRLGVLAFEPVLVNGKAIQVHPLVCAAFNADFDGDQMAVHVPLSKRAVEETRKLMLSTQNLLKPASGDPIVGPTKDMVMGCYYLTMEEDDRRGEGKVFVDLDEVSLAYELDKVDLHAKIKVLYVREQRTPEIVRDEYDVTGWKILVEDGDEIADGTPIASWHGEKEKVAKKGGRVLRRDSHITVVYEGTKHPVETTVGRAIFNLILPDELRFANELMDKGQLKDLVAKCHKQLGLEATSELVDKIKAIGFKYATRSGVTIAVSDLTVPEAKYTILAQVSEQVREVERQYRRGLLTEDEQYSKTIELWTRATDDVTEAVALALDPNGPIQMMAQSGATKGGFQPIRQLAGMRGLMADPAGRIISMPILSNFREGLSTLEYFISTHGARKGLADTALRTADAGYLTRRLVDAAQDAIVNAMDCGTKSGIWIKKADDVGGQALRNRIRGRVAAGPVADPETGEIIVSAGDMITDEEAETIEAAGIEEVYIRSPMTCQLRYGLCAKCYGRDLGRGKMVEVGSAVGIVAAQSIGEPGTQLTLRTFHTGGVVSGGDITHGLPRVEELFEARKNPKGEALMTDIDGMVEVRREEGIRYVKVVYSELLRDEHDIKHGWKILVEDGEDIADGEPIASRGEKKQVVKKGGRVLREDRHITVVHERREEREYEVPSAARLTASEGEWVTAGQQLTEGSKNTHRILHVLGREATQLYLLSEIQQVYSSQGVDINDKHFEVIISKMLNKVQVTSSGDTKLLPGEVVNRPVFTEVNAKVAAEGGRQATAQPLLLGISKAALTTDSFLSAASFQHTIRVLAGAAIEGRQDDLLGLKENVIIGKLIPSGTGFRGWPGHEGELSSETFEDVKLALFREGVAGKPVAALEEEEEKEETTEEMTIPQMEKAKLPLAASS